MCFYRQYDSEYLVLAVDTSNCPLPESAGNLKMSVTPRGMSIQEAYREYREENFVVNRRYQRKLVWTLEEKVRLVDSIINGYPIPLFLFATRTDSAGRKHYEILDGMQRLHSIFSYIENLFDFEGKFFDVDQLSRVKQLSETGEIVAVRNKDQLLEPQTCADFLDYTLAITEFPFQSTNAVNEVFRRINSYGKQLSSQEKRQAGVISPLATTIRELAAEIRGDVSSETLNLINMPSVSINIERQEHGIDADESFWCRQGILRKNQLRDGEDEQLLVDIAISIIEGTPFAFSGGKLDQYYNTESEESRLINEKLLTIGAEVLKHDIIAVISIIRNVFDLDSGHITLRSVLHPSAGGNPIKTAFYALFLAFYELCIVEEKTPDNEERIVSGLQSLHDRLNVAAGSITGDARRQNIDVVKGIVSPFFVDRKPPASQTSYGLTVRFENSLRRSKIETAAFECKQGIVSLDEQRIQNRNIFQRVLETICGIANIGPKSEGAVFVGVADKKSDKDRIEELDQVVPVTVGSRFVVGIERELTHLNVNLEGYKRMFVSELSKSDLSEPLRTSILSVIDLIDYRGRSVLCIWVPPQTKPSTLNDNLYVRQGPETMKVEGVSKVQAVMSLFR